MTSMKPAKLCQSIRRPSRALNDKNRILIAVACIAVSVAVLVMALIGWYHDNKVKTIRESHRAEVVSMRRDFNKQLKRKDDGIEWLKKIDQTIANNCKG